MAFGRGLDGMQMGCAVCCSNASWAKKRPAPGPGPGPGNRANKSQQLTTGPAMVSLMNRRMAVSYQANLPFRRLLQSSRRVEPEPTTNVRFRVLNGFLPATLDPRPPRGDSKYKLGPGGGNLWRDTLGWLMQNRKQETWSIRLVESHTIFIGPDSNDVFGALATYLL
jgi:hypothetical protein